MSSQLAGSCDTGWYAYSVVLKDSFAYVADGENGLVVVQMSTNPPPTIVDCLPASSDVDIEAGITSDPFCVTALSSNSTPLYSWWFNGTNVGNASIYSILPESVSAGDVCELTCYVSDAVWTNAVSQTWNITIRAASPEITLNPPTNFVPYEIAVLSLSGTVNSSVSSLWWTNTLTHEAGSVTVSSNWIAMVSLGVGVNPIEVWASDGVGSLVSASASIERDDQNPILSVVPLTVKKSAAIHSSNDVQAAFVVSNMGGKTLNYSVAYTNGGWFNAIAGISGSLTRDATQSHLITLRPTGLEMGVYTTNFTVFTTGEIHTSQTVVVEFTIRERGGVSAVVLLLLSE